MPRFDAAEFGRMLAHLTCSQFLTDRASDANWLREALAEAGVEAVIPP